MNSFISFIIVVGLSLTIEAAIQPPKGLLKGYDLAHKKSVKVDLKKKPTVYVFLSAKCPCSSSHLAHIQSLSEKFKSFQFIGVNSNQDESLQLSQDYFSSVSVRFPVIRDKEATLANRMGALKTPHSYVVDINGQVLYQGGVTNSTRIERATKFHLQAALSKFNQGDKTPIKETRALGCYITR